MPGRCSLPTPAGMEREKRSTRGVRSRGSASRFLLVRTAIMPQPMSTPTAAGMRVSAKVGMTLPTVAPLPRCASGMSATWPAIPWARESMSACLRVTSSRMLAQFLTFAMGVGFSLAILREKLFQSFFQTPSWIGRRKNTLSEGHPQTPGKGASPLCTPRISVGCTRPPTPGVGLVGDTPPPPAKGLRPSVHPVSLRPALASAQVGHAEGEDDGLV